MIRSRRLKVSSKISVLLFEVYLNNTVTVSMVVDLDITKKLVSCEKWNSCFIPILPGWTFISSRRLQEIPSDARRRNSSFKSLSRGCWEEPAIKTKQHQTHHDIVHNFCDAENVRETRGEICVNLILKKCLNC